MFKMIRTKFTSTKNKTKQNTSADVYRIDKLQERLEENDLLLSNLQMKLSGTNAIVYRIEKDRYDNYTFVCVQDHRKLKKDFNTETFHLCGELNIFVLSPVIFPQKIPGKYIDMPYLQATFYKNHVKIDELHSKINNISYEKKGYGTMMVNTLVDLAKKENCKYITGKLSEDDAKTTYELENRNNFYLHRGFNIDSDDPEKRNGKIYLEL